MKTYQTERLILKPTSTEDIDFLLDILNTPKYYQYIGDRKVRTAEDATKYLNERIRPQYEELGFGNFTVIRKTDGIKIGFCGIYVRPTLEVPDIGFAFFEAYERQGYAYEASLELMERAKEEFGLKKLAGITLEENLSSRKLLEKLGLQFQKKFFMDGDPEELMYYEKEL